MTRSDRKTLLRRGGKENIQEVLLMAKRIVSAVLALALVLSLLGGLPLGMARAVTLDENETERDEFTEVVASGVLSNITWSLDSDGCLTITGKGAMPHCELETEVPWLEYADDIKSAVISEGITTVGILCFYKCLSLESVVIPDGVTSIGAHAFEWCRSLTEVILPDTVQTIGLSAFYNCDGIEKLELGSGVTNILSNAFNMCRSVTEITFPASLTELQNYSFASCDNLTSVTFLGDAPTFSGQPFSGTGIFPNDTLTCYYPADNATWTSDVRSSSYGGNIIWEATGETEEPTEPETTEPEIIASGVQDNLTWVLDATGCLTLTGKGKMPICRVSDEIPWLEYADQITSAVVSKGFYNICPWCFMGCNNLKSVSIPNTVSAINMYSFYGCGLESVTIPDGVIHINTRAFRNCSKLKEIVLPDTVELIESGAFEYCGGLEKLDLGNGVKTIEKYAFDSCQNLTEVRFPASVETLEYGCFRSCLLTTIVFEGDAPEIHSGAFDGTGTYPVGNKGVTAYYPANNATWTEDKLQNYGGRINWVPYNDLSDLDHTHSYTSEVTAPTCTEPGYTTYTCTCGDSYTDSETEALGHSYTAVVTEPTCTERGYTIHTCATCGDNYIDSETDALGHSYINGICTACGEEDPTDPDEEPEESGEVQRLAGSDRFTTAFLVADQMKTNLGIDAFDSVIVASGTNFADALSGSYLAAVKNAPILLSFSGSSKQAKTYNQMVQDYILNNLTPGGTVYILGGPSAVPEYMEDGLELFQVKRLAGADRFGTNLAILEEAGVGDKDILVCTGLSFADSLSASASKMPILLVWNKLTDAQKEFLSGLNGNNLYIIGGESAVSMDMQNQVAEYGPVDRIGGSNRFETSVLIAEWFFDDPDSAVLAYAWNYPDGLCGGALAATMDAPLILTMTKYETQAAEYIQGYNITTGTVLGGTGLISDKSVELIFPQKTSDNTGNQYEDELPIG